MGRHSQPDLPDARPASPGRASGSLAGEPTWDHWWEKTGGQPRISEPVLDEPLRSGPVRSGPASRPDPAPPRGRRAGGPSRPAGPAVPASPPPLGPTSTGPIPLSPAFPVSPDEPPHPRRSLRSVPGAGEAGGPGSGGGGGFRRGGARAGGYPGAAAAAAAPLSYDTSPGLAVRDTPTPAAEPPDSGRLSGPPRRPGAGAGTATTILPPPGRSAASAPDRTGETPRIGGPGFSAASAPDRTGEMPRIGGPGLSAPPAPDRTGETPRIGGPGFSAASAPDRTGETPRIGSPGLAAPPAPDRTGETPRNGGPADRPVRAVSDPDADPGGSRRSRRRGRRSGPAEDAVEAPEQAWISSLRAGTDRPERDRPAVEPGPDDPEPVRTLHAVHPDPDASEQTGIHYGFEDEPSLLLQWGGFVLQTIVGAACGLGCWLGFYQLWNRWPLYTVPAAGAAMAIMLAITRSIRRRYGHDLDLLTAVLTVGVGVVLTVLPAAFVLQHV